MGKPETQEEKYKTMTEKPVSSLICRLAVPTIISMLVTSFYNMADTFFVARIGTSATAAVGVSFALMAIIQAFGFFCGHGSGNYISRKMGQHRFDEAQQMAATGFFMAAGAGHGDLFAGGNLDRSFVPDSGRDRNHSALRPPVSALNPDRRAVYDGFACAQQSAALPGSAFYAMIGIASGQCSTSLWIRCSSLSLTWGSAGLRWRRSSASSSASCCCSRVRPRAATCASACATLRSPNTIIPRSSTAACLRCAGRD